MKTKLCKKYPPQITYFESDLSQLEIDPGTITLIHTYFWSNRYGNNLCVFTVITDVDVNGDKFLTITQQFEVQNVNHGPDTYEILEQCVYINYDAILCTLETKFHWFKASSGFSPFDEKVLKKDLGLMMTYLPPPL
jgi:hypothetical protein